MAAWKTEVGMVFCGTVLIRRMILFSGLLQREAKREARGPTWPGNAGRRAFGVVLDKS